MPRVAAVHPSPAPAPPLTPEPGRMVVRRYRSIRDVPAAAWDALAPTAAVGLERPHLAAIEASGVNGIRPHHLLVEQGGEPVGIAHAFAIDLDLARLGSDVPAHVIATLKRWDPGFLAFRVLEVGFISGLGLGVAAAPGRLGQVLPALSAALDEVAREEHAGLVLVRDVPLAAYDDLRPLEAHGYAPALGFPIARMPLGFESFDAYLAALRSEKRSNLRRKRARLAAPELAVEILEDYAPHASRLAALWENVARKRADYEHERLDPRWFEEMARHLRGRSRVLAIRRHGEIVAFALALVGDAEYFWAFVGLDYEHRDAYDLYFNLVLEGIRDAIGCGSATLNLGITTYDFKGFVGAELHRCVYLVKSVADPRLSTAFADMFESGIPQPDERHDVFRDRPRLAPPCAAVEARAHLRRGEDRRDPFRKLRRYVRTDVMRAAGIWAFRPAFEGAQEPCIRHRGRDVVMLGTNSYLGLATDPHVRKAAHEAIDRYGTGCSGSPLLNGTLDLHDALAERLARFAGKDDALVFSTGYQTNVGVVSALAGRDDVIVADERNHASLVDGARLSGARVVRYRHADVAALDRALEEHAGQPKLVVTDSLFSMEGTVVDLPAIVRAVRRHGARLMLDESHAMGVLGPGGRGVAAMSGLTREVDVLMGTFSKSFASVGGFVAADAKVIDSLRTLARSQVFSASLPPASVAAVLAALEVVEREPERRERLLAHARFLADGLRALGYRVSHQGSAIVPVFCGDELLALGAFHRLFEHGVFVNPVLYPAVPKRQEILRLSVMATFERPLLERALSVFDRIRTPTWP